MNLQPNIILSFEKVQRLFDMIVHSMDFGSGFLETDDVNLLREIAGLIGVDPMVGTPSTFKGHYKHTFSRHSDVTINRYIHFLNELTEFDRRREMHPQLGRVPTTRDIENAQRQLDYTRNDCRECYRRGDDEIHS